MSARELTRALVEKVVTPFGVPERLLSDRGPGFTSSIMTEVCRLLRTHKVNTFPCHPQGNGLVERFNCTLQSMLSHYVNSYHTDWDKYLGFVCMAYNTCPHDRSGLTPHEVLFGRPSHSFLDAGLPDLHPNQVPVNAQEALKDFHAHLTLIRDLARSSGAASTSTAGSTDRSPNPFRVGYEVLVYNPLTPRVNRRAVSAKLHAHWEGLENGAPWLSSVGTCGVRRSTLDG